MGSGRRWRRSASGELVQWDTSEHDWLEGRGERLYLIAMIDDATGELTARFARHDSTEENMRLLWSYVEKHGRPVAFYTDKASLFQTAPKVKREEKALLRDERDPLPPTQIGRALQEMQIAWIAAHSPQAKGRIERAFSTAQDRLVKGLRLASASTLKEANRHLEQEFLPWWNQRMTVVPANPGDAHRSLGPDHELASSLSHVEQRQVVSDYTFATRAGSIRLHRAASRRVFVLARCVWKSGSTVPWRCVFARLISRERMAGSAQSSRGRQAEAANPACQHQRATHGGLAPKQSGSIQPGPSMWAAASANRTRTRDTLD